MKTRTKNYIHSAVATMAVFTLVVTPLMAETSNEIADKDITDAVTVELIVDDAVSANSITLTTDDGVVTLDGKVKTILAKERAAEIAAATVGVRSIINLIEVAPADKVSDKDLIMAVENAWIDDPATEGSDLKAVADNGVVSISGKAQSYAERKLAETVAKGVKGVKEVKNKVNIEYDVERTDLEIQEEIVARLENDIRVDDKLINVEVDNGKVKLRGTVGSLTEKNQAASDAWVTGVASVDTDYLEIESWARDDMRRKSIFISRSDEEIKKAVEDAFLYDPRVLSFKPEVDVFSGTVTLRGSVDNLKAKKAAEADARNTVGVWRVRNHLKVEADIVDNEELRERVEVDLENDPHVETSDINISASDGWVYLSGEVNTSFERNRAEWVAEGVRGVAGVVNSITYGHFWHWKPDWEIREDIKDQLQYSAFVDARDVSVLVDDGVATLSGTVESWSEYQEAEKNAYQGGAKDVTNLLKVDYGYYGPYGPTYYGAGYHGEYYNDVPDNVSTK